MCGICASLLFQFTDDKTEKCYSIRNASEFSLRRRGPDYFKSECVQCACGVQLEFCASVLHMQGQHMAAQPYTDEYGNILLWNGEIFGGDLYSEADVSDTVALSNLLSRVHSAEDVLNIVTRIKGPYALIYYQNKQEKLWFGRDIFGRRSLLWSFSQTSPLMFLLSSVALEKQEWLEVPCDGIFCLDFVTSYEKKHVIIKNYPWTYTISGCFQRPSEISCDSSLYEIIFSDMQIQSPITMALNRALPCNSTLPGTLSENVLYELLQIPSLAETVEKLESVLSQAILRRIKNQRSTCKNCFLNSIPLDLPCSHSSISILFSGGLDSIVIAALTDKHLPNEIPLDLLNVAFECHEKRKTARCGKLDSQTISHFNTPDRITGRNGLLELMRLNDARHWNFVEIDVSQSELETERIRSISKLIAPLCTVLDDSIGCAIWFAARGKGSMKCTDDNSAYSSPSRVVLVGMGADELFAGYSRHRAKFNAGGWSSLIDEMSLELDRISMRNLGRDDRIISDHGREARFPFLDEDVVSFLNSTHIWLKADLRYPRGIGEKLLLRLLAFKLGLKEAALLPKRAIQFGSRIARCENSKEKGSDVCERLKQLSVLNRTQ